MKQMSSMDLYFLTKELIILENQRIDSFYLDNDIFYMKVYVKNLGNRLLTFNVGKYLYLGESKEDSKMPSSFVQYLRKHLKNTFIRSVFQIPQERILRFEIESKKGDDFIKYYLFLEIFTPGNIILTDSNFEIINMFKRKKFKDRSVVVREKYELPPQKDLNFSNIDKNDFCEKFKISEMSIVKFLATKFGMGGKYAEEICNLSSIDKNKTELNNNEIDLIIEKINLILSKDIDAFYVLNKEFLPFDFKSINEEKEKVSSFNCAIKNYFSSFKDQKDKNEEVLLKELKKLENRLKKQEETKDKIDTDYEKYNSYGNKIYENYALIEELLRSINNVSKEKGWDYIIDKIKTDEKLKFVKKLNYKNNEIIIEL